MPVQFFLHPVIRLHRSTTHVDAACCYRPSSVVCQSVAIMSPAEIAELIEMLFYGLGWPQGSMH